MLNSQGSALLKNKNDMKSEEEVIQFEKVQTQIKGLYNEIGILSKKNPNDAVNNFKLNLINQSLKEANELLGSKYKPYADFDVFREDEIPKTSDVVMILSLYINALERLKGDNVKIKESQSEWIHGHLPYWVIDGKVSNLEA
jgi:hypothetical protein